MTAKKPVFPPDEAVCRSMFPASPPLPNGRGGWIRDTPQPTPPSPPRRTPRPRVIRDVEQAVAIHEALHSLGKAVHQLKQTGLSHAEIEEAFRAEMTGMWDEAN